MNVTSVGERKINTGVRLTPTLLRYLAQCDGSTADVVEDAVRRTAGFRRWVPVAVIVLLSAASACGQSTPAARAAAQEARAAGISSGIRAAANRRAALNAMKNATLLAHRQADRLVNPPMRDYSRTDRKVVETLLSDSAAYSAAYRLLRDNADTEYALWEQANEIALVDYYHTIIDRFEDPKEMKDVGSKGYILDKQAVGIPQLRINHIGGEGDGGWLNLRYRWWITGIDVEQNFDGDRIDAEDYVFEVIGQKKIPTIKGLDIGTATIRHVHATKKPMEGLPERPTPPPAPVGVTEREAMVAVFPDANDLTMGGKTALCGYIRRVRVQTRKYDVYVMLLHEDDLHLAWIPWTQFAKPDAIWIAKTDRERRAAK